MEIVVLDGHTLNPGDLSWDGLEEFGTLRVYDRTPLSKETLEKDSRLRFVGVLATESPRGYLNLFYLSPAPAARPSCTS
jgi:hypothetical protein